MNWFAAITKMIYIFGLIIGTAYIVFWKGYSGWWWLLTLLLLSAASSENEGDK